MVGGVYEGTEFREAFGVRRIPALSFSFPSAAVYEKSITPGYGALQTLRGIRRLNILELSRAIADALGRDADTLEHRKEEVGHWRFLAEFHVTTGVQDSAAFAGKQDGQIIMIVCVAIANGAAINDHAIVQERSFPFTNGFQFFKKISKVGHVEAIDLGNFLLLRLIVAMM